MAKQRLPGQKVYIYILYINSNINYNLYVNVIDYFQAYQDRIKEEEQKEAETARLEEILNMCAEYERQIASGTYFRKK